MKQLLFILLFAPIFAFAQLHGRYYWIYPHYAYSYYEFKAGHKFKFESNGCTGGWRGQGTYSLTDTTLAFHFDPQKGGNNPMKITYYERGIEPSLSDSILLYLYDNVDSQPLHGALIYLNKDTISVGITNRDGKIRVQIEDINKDVNIDIRYRGERFSLIIDKKWKARRIDWGLAIKPSRLPARTYTYYIGTISRKLIELKSDDDAEFTRYEKK